jgi:hypothetical protein
MIDYFLNSFSELLMKSAFFRISVKIPDILIFILLNNTHELCKIHNRLCFYGF